MTTKKTFTDSIHLKRWKNAGPEKNLIWLDSAIKFAKAKKTPISNKTAKT